MAKTKPKKGRTTKSERPVLEKLARIIDPEAWEEYDAGNGRCSNDAGLRCITSLEVANRLMDAFPGIIPIVRQSSSAAP